MQYASYVISEDYSRVFRRRLLLRKSSASDALSIVPSTPKGPSLRGRLRCTFADRVSRLGERYVGAQTSDTNNVWPVIPVRLKTFQGIRFMPDGTDLSFGLPPVVGDVKVGGSGSYEQAEDSVVAVEKGKARPGIIYLLESPVSGEGKARP